MAPNPPPAVPPVTAEYASTMHQAGAASPAAPSSYTFTRAADGKTRVDSGNTSVISNPAAAQTILLDHLKKTATIQPQPAPAMPKPGAPPMPIFAAPAMPGAPQVPAVKVEDLGKNILQGHEVEGKRFVIPPIAMPKPPAVPMPALPIPAMPKMPQIPGMPAVALPKAPAMPGAPAVAPPKPPAPPPPQGPATAEVWSSIKMRVPMLTKMSGSFGQLTQVCQKAIPGEPHPSTFQIPPGYKVTA